ncbi:putative Poly(A) polymerase [Phytophthora cinnamomi]|uniref:putative Poly(A) polymerase n=1 Tax=Phytophthora cinnamomi TaxID=4785 RepID=UPI00355ABD9C|nr:putative Poly(A) polymerase [Phytophthora cinnamomi]
MCWGDAERTRKLKQALRTEDSGAFDAHKKDSDTCSGGRTSCSSSHDALWDDDDVSTAGSDDGGSVSSSTSSSSRGGSPVSSKTPTSEPLQLALEACHANWTEKRAEQKALLQQTMQPPLPSGSPGAHRTKDQEAYLKTLRSAAAGLRRVVPIVVPAELAPPSEYDLRSTNGLMKCVNAIAPLPTPEQLSAKHLVINELQRVVDIWLRRTLDALEGAPETKSTETATLLLGGSWHLKVGMAESDLDVVAFMPHAVTSEIFFSSLCEHLGKEASVSDLVARRKAAVPVLSFQLNSVRVDLLFARYAQKQAVPKHLPFLPGDEMQVMRGMDATSVRSLSVARVASLILELVPNASVFRSCLRVIRLWARRRGLYSNKAGYLGGISWALLVCFVCQMFPRASVASIVHRFFSVLASWRWPTPILVAHPSNGGNADNVQWDPQHNIHDRAHLMPIITPGFPAVNTAVNVNISTLRVLREEFARGQRIMDDLRRRSLSHPSSWNQLFTPTEVLVRYDHHIAIELRAPNEEALAEWSSFVASRTRKLVETLQHTPSVATLHPLPEIVRPQGAEAKENEVVGYYFIGYTINAPPSPQPRRGDRRHSSRAPASRNAGNEELARNCVTSATRYFLATELDAAAEKKPGMEVEINYRSWNDLPSAVFPGGRTAAVGERARFILSQAHHVNLALGLCR